MIVFNNKHTSFITNGNSGNIDIQCVKKTIGLEEEGERGNVRNTSWIDTTTTTTTTTNTLPLLHPLFVVCEQQETKKKKSYFPKSDSFSASTHTHPKKYSITLTSTITINFASANSYQDNHSVAAMSRSYHIYFGCC